MLKKIVIWMDQNILACLAIFLMVFIPLYPKLPLFDIIPGYIVRVRIEDILIAITIVIYGLQLLRKRVQLRTDNVSLGLYGYLFFGLLSVIAAVFIIQSVPLQFLHVGKTVLHWLRRVEYFSLFFIAFSSLNTNKKIRIALIAFFLTLLGVIIYGYGQKYLYWPAFSTMNREFSKGWVLYLTEHARVLSTFGGHYDLAGYLVIALSLGWSFFFGAKNKLMKLVFGLLIASGFWLLILTASRISFIGYLAGLSVVTFLWTFKKGLGWGVSRFVIAVSLSIILMLSFGDLSDRFLKLFRLSERVAGIREILLRPAGAPPTNKNAAFLENNLAAVTSKSDQPPTPVGGYPGDGTVPVDVNSNQAPLFLPEKTASGSIILVEKSRTYSKNALLFDLSTGIRLDATWPRAIAGFKNDPLLGNGYATLTKATKYEFTEAESTDSDYLRALGETGLLGFVSFFGSILLMGWVAFRSLRGIKDSYLYALVSGFVALIFGLLLNATLIDIFEASKVAYVFWGVSGLVMATLLVNKNVIRADQGPFEIKFYWSDFFQKIKKVLSSDRFWVSFVLVLTFCIRLYKVDGPVADWHSWRQADTSAVTRNFIKSDRINWLYPIYDDLSSIPSGKPNPQGFRYVEFPIYNAAAVYLKKVFPELTTEGTSRETTALASCLSVLFIFLICRKIFSRRVGYLSAIIFAVVPYSIFYGHAILPDPSMVAASMGAIWFALLFVTEKKKRYFSLSLVLAIVALLIKPYAIFLLSSIAYLWYAGFGLNIKKIIMLFFYYCVALLPLVVWRWWISFHPEAIPASDWLFNGDGIRFKGAFFYWLFADRIGRLILGYWGLVPLAFGLVSKSDRKFGLYPLVLFGCSLVYLVVFATGNVRHDYYQILLLPSLSILVGLGFDFLLTKKLQANYVLSIILSIVCFGFMIAFGWYFIKDFYNINHPEIVLAGKKMEELSNAKALVVSPYNGDTAFLYQTNRQGWPYVEKGIDYLISQGADYYVSVNYDDLTNELIADSWPAGLERPANMVRKYKLLEKNDKFVIIQLVPDNLLPRD